jgi:hypothetical protein
VATVAVIVAAAVIIAATTERAGTPQIVQRLSRGRQSLEGGEIFSLPADKTTRHGAPFKP